MRQTCTDHCAGCDQHFHGLGAFDAHRVNDACGPAGDAKFAKGKREGESILQVWTDTGSCDKMPGCWKDGKLNHWDEGVTIWQMSQTEEQKQRLKEAWKK